jgi:hypothetical protein
MPATQWHAAHDRNAGCGRAGSIIFNPDAARGCEAVHKPRGIFASPTLTDLAVS